ncbi:MAG: antitoxin MazE family protein [Devosia sp.]|uniref:antitoxin MazE family protein n=1 Tax=Devosia sp. TaxID=1871048 RepID=UPI001A5B6F51|nr:antitoxin MazE family protein [Devosia sp.]MBL8597068.1 antitoxin MazE family protein [Devosia sp.]
MGTPGSQRAQKYRETMRAKGMRLVQKWVIDTQTPEFKAEARRQSLIIAEANRKNREELDLLDAALDEALAELEGDEDLIGRPDNEGK